MPLLRTPETTHRIHPQDCDPPGHLNNVRYLDYLLYAREQHTTQHYALNLGALAQKQGGSWVITKHYISYLRPAHQDETVLIRSQIIHFDNSSLVVEMQMLSEDGQRLKALLWSEMAFMALKTSTHIEHSEALMDMLEEIDVADVEYDPDGFDDRVLRVRKQLKRLRKA